MRVSHPHGTTQCDAVRRMETVVTSITERYGGQVSDVEQSWSGNVMHFAFRVRDLRQSGSVTVTESDLVLEMELPLAARFFEEHIRKVVTQTLRELLPGG